MRVDTDRHKIIARRYALLRNVQVAEEHLPVFCLVVLGWSFGIVAASALLTESVEEHDRVAVQGAADMATNIASGTGALASGIVLDMAGFHILSMVGMAAAGGLLVHSFFENRVASAQLRI